MDNLLLTPEQAAELLHVGRTTLYGLLRDGALRAVHIGRLCRVPHAELVRYVGALATTGDAAIAEPTPMVGRAKPRRRTGTDQAEPLGTHDAVRPQAG